LDLLSILTAVRYNCLFCKYDLCSTCIRTSRATEKKGGQKGVEHHTPNHLKVDHSDEHTTIFKEGIFSIWQAISDCRTCFKTECKRPGKGKGFAIACKTAAIFWIAVAVANRHVYTGKYNNHARPDYEQKRETVKCIVAQNDMEPISAQETKYTTVRQVVDLNLIVRLVKGAIASDKPWYGSVGQAARRACGVLDIASDGYRNPLVCTTPSRCCTHDSTHGYSSLLGILVSIGAFAGKEAIIAMGRKKQDAR
jgi:hypothetical protein